MKQILLTIACLLGAIVSSNAQQKLWTWKPKNEKAHHGLHGMAMHESGEAAFVVSEFDSTGEKVRFLIVWLKKDGKARMVRKVALGGFRKGEDAVDYFLPAAFSVSFLGDDAIAIFPTVNNGGEYKVRVYKSRGGGPPKLTLLYPNVMFFGTSRFAGWVEKDFASGSYTESRSGQQSWYEDLKSLTAWKL